LPSGLCVGEQLVRRDGNETNSRLCSGGASSA
jgi:hypothetical protein